MPTPAQVAHHAAYRKRILPSQLDLARRKYRSLIGEAQRIGMTELLEPGEESATP